MVLCNHCNKEVTQEDEKGYEVQVSRWTMDFPRVREYFHYHEDCWSERFNTAHRSMPSSMDDLFGQFIEP